MDLEEVFYFVGVTGLPGAGKGAFIDTLRPLLAEQGISSRYFSLSDVLRAEARRRGRAVERPVLRDIANELRLERGSGVLSQLVIEKIRSELSGCEAGETLIVIIDSIRNPEEVDVLRRELPARFDLVAVDAPLDILVARIAARARDDEREEVVHEKEAARRMILGELGDGEPAHGHDIKTCIEQADWLVDNSDALEALVAQTNDFIRTRIPARAES